MQCFGQVNEDFLFIISSNFLRNKKINYSRLMLQISMGEPIAVGKIYFCAI